MDTFEKLEYRIKAGIEEAKAEKTRRLSDRVKLPLKGLNGEEVYSIWNFLILSMKMACQQEKQSLET